ncbi:HD-GYP domain-containing protein [Alkalicoccus daliensis]|uniref:HD-GYP domain, c-di-GMP phosphodiesterase class II (Or its inactivated variant) n=1 Tax=Alkalicoccus daliensis TaxID=745820 RepID=A0A1H0J5X4_9BACI|nr:HD domain-containing phosphohydrolase [Alkalicoccus daliensis]SDO39107.1 HD-GYP domain, c-di-GMP phosphodiesterase class II (or its inactivated variant) [Alkalicoccus daliensis]
MEWVDIKQFPYLALDRKVEEDIFSGAGHLLLRKGMILTTHHVAQLLQHDIRKIRLGESTSVLEQMTGKLGEKHQTFLALYQKQYESLRPVFEAAENNELLPLEEPLVLFEDLIEEALNGINLLEVLQQMQGHSEYTLRHSIHVGLISSLIAQLQNFSKEHVLEIGKSGLMHDIGKLKISNDIIQKPGALTNEEFTEIKKHPEKGYDLLQTNPVVSEMMLLGALEHHERIDGSGYPHRKKGEKLSETGRIVAIADVFDAISSDRSYKRKRSPLTALKVISDDIFAGRLSSKLGMPFVGHMLSSYTGSYAYLSDGRIGQIIQIPLENMEHPMLYVEGKMLSAEESKEVEIIDFADARSKKMYLEKERAEAF